MKLIITGGTGYIGGRLVNYLESEIGLQVNVGTRRLQYENVPESNAKFVYTDYSSIEELKRVCVGIDVVIHVAGMNANDCIVDPLSAIEVNTIQTARLLRAAILSGVKRFIYFSTAHVYNLHGLINEDSCPLNLHPYATSHRAAEDAVRFAHKHGEIEGIVVRLSNSFGAPVSRAANCWSLLANDLCRQAITMRNMTLRSSGMQRRDFISMTDVCRATHHLLSIPLLFSDNIVFNIGGNWSPTIWDFACQIQAMCKEIVGFEPQLFRGGPVDDEVPTELDYSIDKLKGTGFVLISNHDEEVGQLLRYCQDTFA
jgi:UDP-glucose 4-epimerase